MKTDYYVANMGNVFANKFSTYSNKYSRILGKCEWWGGLSTGISFGLRATIDIRKLLL